MMGSKWVAGAARSLIAASLSWQPLARTMAAEPAQAVAYVDGRRVELQADAVRANGLIEACELQARGANTVLRLGVTEATIDAQRQAGLALEIRYSAPRHFVLEPSGRDVVASRLLIPLAGELSGKVSTIFLGNPDYRSGPLRNSAGSADLALQVRAVLAQQAQNKPGPPPAQR